eukprot:6100508-Prymnesium_polylepis.1
MTSIATRAKPMGPGARFARCAPPPSAAPLARRRCLTAADDACAGRRFAGRPTPMRRRTSVS